MLLAVPSLAGLPPVFSVFTRHRKLDCAYLLQALIGVTVSLPPASSTVYLFFHNNSTGGKRKSVSIKIEEQKKNVSLAAV